MELKYRNVQHARNLLNKAVTLLPRIDQLWYKYTYLEELLQNIPGARQVFERWMKWEPDDKAWQAYIKLEVPGVRPSKRTVRALGGCSPGTQSVDKVGKV